MGMTNKEVCDYVKTINPKKNSNGEEYISEKCVREGYGQSSGGFYKKANAKDLSQKEHFLEYYGKKDKAKNPPTYSYLRCPQLLLFIAEIAGVPREMVEVAYGKIQEYDKGYTGKDKNGNYMWGDKERGIEVLRELKRQLHISDLEEIIFYSSHFPSQSLFATPSIFPSFI